MAMADKRSLCRLSTVILNKCPSERLKGSVDLTYLEGLLSQDTSLCHVQQAAPSIKGSFLQAADITGDVNSNRST